MADSRVKKITDPENSALTYIPRMPELALVTGIGLVHGKEPGLWLDVAPYGDPELVRADDFMLSDDGGTIRFVAAGETCQVDSGAACDRILFSAMADIASRAVVLRHDGRDRIEVLFEQGRIESLRVGRFEEGNPEDYFTVIFREQGMFYVRGAPHARVPLRSLIMRGEALVAVAEGREFRYEVQSEPFLLDLLGRLIDSPAGMGGS